MQTYRRFYRFCFHKEMQLQIATRMISIDRIFTKPINRFIFGLQKLKYRCLLDARSAIDQSISRFSTRRALDTNRDSESSINRDISYDDWHSKSVARRKIMASTK